MSDEQIKAYAEQLDQVCSQMLIYCIQMNISISECTYLHMYICICLEVCSQMLIYCIQMNISISECTYLHMYICICFDADWYLIALFYFFSHSFSLYAFYIRM
jgi:hypothetical protein